MANDIVKPENLVYTKTKVLTDNVMHYCPGCGHGTAHRIIAEVIDEMGIQDKTVGVSPVGCSVLAYNYFDVDFQEAAHGRAPAVATAIKRLNPDTYVFTYQGDGDLAAIGTAETVHAATRGENITVIFINNCIYGMTGGQMAPTTLIGQKTTTSVYGRTVEQAGLPLRMCEILSQIDCAVFVERVILNSPANVRKAKAVVKKALDIQDARLGFTFVEFLSACPTNWGLAPKDALEWLRQNMIPYYPLGVYKDGEAIRDPE